MASPLTQPARGLRLRVRKTLWRLRRWFRPHSPVVVPYDDGLQIRLRPQDRLGRRVYCYGYSDLDHALLLHAFLRPGMTYVDVGANFGQFTLVAARRVGPGGAVHAFEATSRMYAELAANVELNRLTWVRHNHAAVCARSGTIEIRLCAPGFESFSSLGRPLRPNEQLQGSESVPAVTLDEYGERAGISRIDLLKIDVEGAEHEVIKGASRLLSRPDVQSLVCEFNDVTSAAMGSSSQALRAALEAHGFGLYALDYDSFALTPELPTASYPRTRNLLALKAPQAFAAALDRTVLDKGPRA